jgi:hypothetical protein
VYLLDFGKVRLSEGHAAKDDGTASDLGTRGGIAEIVVFRAIWDR